MIALIFLTLYGFRANQKAPMPSAVNAYMYHAIVDVAPASISAVVSICENSPPAKAAGKDIEISVTTSKVESNFLFMNEYQG